MRKQFLEVCFKNLHKMHHDIEHYESIRVGLAEDMHGLVPFPMTYEQCLAIGGFLKEVGVATNDYELIGVGDTFLNKSAPLMEKELDYHQE